jgi:radical SAM superfamily enzyme YgiQ (UPF0313 family)
MRIILASPEAKVWSVRKHIPLGLGYLAAVLREGGHEVMIFDASIEDVNVDYYLDSAEAEGRPYQLIGVTATTPLMPDAWAVAKLAKQRGLITVLGGPHLTIMPLESMQAGPDPGHSFPRRRRDYRQPGKPDDPRPRRPALSGP